MGVLDGVAAFLSRIILIFAVISFFIAIIDLFVNENISLLFLNVIGLIMGFFLQIARVLNFFPYLAGDFSEIPRFLENMILFFLIIGGLFLEISAAFFVSFLFLPLDLFFGAIQTFYNSLGFTILGIEEILNGVFLVVGEPIIIEGITILPAGELQITPSAGQVINDLKNIATSIFEIFLEISATFFIDAFGISVKTGGVEFMLRILAIESGLSPTLEGIGTALGAAVVTNTALATQKLRAEQRAKLSQAELDILFFSVTGE